MSVISDIFVFFVTPQRADFQNLAFWTHFLKGQSNIIRKLHTVPISWESVNGRPIFRKEICSILWDLQSPASMDFRIFCAFIHIQDFSIICTVILYFCLLQSLPGHLSFLLRVLLFIQIPQCIFLLFPLPLSLLVDFLSCDSALCRLPSKSAHTRPRLESQVRWTANKCSANERQNVIQLTSMNQQSTKEKEGEQPKREGETVEDNRKYWILFWKSNGALAGCSPPLRLGNLPCFHRVVWPDWYPCSCEVTILPSLYLHAHTRTLI